MHSPTSYRSTRTARDAACPYVSINFACTVPTCSGSLFYGFSGMSCAQYF